MVVSDFGVIQSGSLPPNTSAQLVELVALTKALELSKEKRISIYIQQLQICLPNPLHPCSYLEGMRNAKGFRVPC
jgi:hypothetical protein